MMKEKIKCKTCRWGFGLWAVGDSCGVGPMDAADGVPIKRCPTCGGKGIPKDAWRTLEGEYIKIPSLEDDHLTNIIKHISERENSPQNKKWLKKMLAEQKKRNIKLPPLEITGTVDGRTNTRKWGSKKRDVKNDHHKKGKKWYFHEGIKRTKLRWNKKKGKRERSKKGSRDKVFWAD